MIRLEKPEFDVEQIVNACVSNMNEGERKNRIISSTNEIVKESKEYDTKASSGMLSSIEIHEELRSGASKDDMKKLYEDKFVPKGQGGREYYDAIKSRSPNNRCPYCAQREVSTLDHYLPKAKYPTFSVTPYNLIPSCKDCNTGKLTDVFNSREEEVIHPYYDDFSTEEWIVAKMIERDPVAFEFQVKCPESWDETKKKRAENHFDKFHLNDLYKPYAAEEYVSCFSRIKRSYLRGGKDLAIENLKEDIDDKKKLRLNTWQAAMYQAIIDSEWFWNVHMPEQCLE